MVLIPSYRGVCDHKDIGCFQLQSNGFPMKLIALKLIALKILDANNLCCYCCWILLLT